MSDYPKNEANRGLIQYNLIITISDFYMQLFSILRQTHCAHVACDLKEWLQPFMPSLFLNIHQGGVFTIYHTDSVQRSFF